MSNKPVAWAMPRPDGLVLDVICPDEHEAFAGDYTVPLYATPQQAQPAPAVPADLQETASRIESGEITNAHFSHRNLVMCSKEHYAALVDAPAAQCDGGTCGAGGYCADCPKQQPAPAPVVPAWLRRMDEILSNATVTRTDAEIVDAAWLAFKEGWESMYAAPAVPNLVESHLIRTAPVVPLTQDQIVGLAENYEERYHRWVFICVDELAQFARAIEQAHGIAAPGEKP